LSNSLVRVNERPERRPCSTSAHAARIAKPGVGGRPNPDARTRTMPARWFGGSSRPAVTAGPSTPVPRRWPSAARSEQTDWWLMLVVSDPETRFGPRAILCAVSPSASSAGRQPGRNLCTTSRAAYGRLRTGRRTAGLARDDGRQAGAPHHVRPRRLVGPSWSRRPRRWLWVGGASKSTCPRTVGATRDRGIRCKPFRPRVFSQVTPLA
jgi:hypothetical protein